MEFVLYTARDEGRLRPGGPLSGPEVRGCVSVRESRCTELRRWSRVASMAAPSGMALSVASLWDATLVYAANDLWVLSGIEVLHAMAKQPRICAQTWLLIPRDYFANYGARALKKSGPVITSGGTPRPALA